MTDEKEKMRSAAVALIGLADALVHECGCPDEHYEYTKSDRPKWCTGKVLSDGSVTCERQTLKERQACWHFVGIDRFSDVVYPRDMEEK